MEMRTGSRTKLQELGGGKNACKGDEREVTTGEAEMKEWKDQQRTWLNRLSLRCVTRLQDRIGYYASNKKDVLTGSAVSLGL